MSINPENLPTQSFIFYDFINDVLGEVIKKYHLEDDASAYLKSTYFFYFYHIRVENNLLNDDYVVIDFKTFNDISHDCLKIFKRDYSKISHQYVTSIVKEKLMLKNKKNSDVLIEFTNFNVNIKDNQNINHILSFDNKVLETTHYIFKQFSAKNIPIELYMVLIYDVYLTYEANKEEDIFQDTIFIYQTILCQIDTIGKTIYMNDQKQISCLHTPPLKSDLRFNMKKNVFDGSASIELLTHYFGDDVWHKQFVNYNENNRGEYFCFNEESYFKLVQNEKRDYKEISIPTDNTEEFLSDEFRDMFFRFWEYRLTKDEKVFFNKYIKPSILLKKEKIEFRLSDFDNLDLKKLINGIRDTSSFIYEKDDTWGSINVIQTMSEMKDLIELEISQSIYSP